MRRRTSPRAGKRSFIALCSRHAKMTAARVYAAELRSEIEVKMGIKIRLDIKLDAKAEKMSDEVATSNDNDTEVCLLPRAV